MLSDVKTARRATRLAVAQARSAGPTEYVAAQPKVLKIGYEKGVPTIRGVIRRAFRSVHGVSGDVAIGVRPCGGIDRSNEYCCDDGSTGVGSFACCSDESNIFAYDNITTLPTILATIPLDDVSTIAVDLTLSSAPPAGTTSDMSTGPLTSESTSKPTSTGSIAIQVTGASTVPTESESSPTNANISTALGAGLGVGLPVAAAIIGGIWFMIWRYKQKDTGGIEQEKEPQYGALDNVMVPGDNTPKLVSSPSSSGLYGVPSVRGANTHELPSNYYGRELPA
ncbi:hypothetical protein Daesc_007482 [Daldinia eschscholtzii]|uniref:Mid2 domain-containing protein n=1 Tax=Daldinia eschscholtzii TaxID=292717 RepID=A0AAX6MEN9_9PEZI